MRKKNFYITASIIQSFYICKRETWFMYRNISPNINNLYLKVGNLIHKNSYKKYKKQIKIDNVIFDIIQNKKQEIFVMEIKKSSSALYASKMQLAFYLSFLKNMGIQAKGIISIPNESKTIKLELNNNLENKLNKTIVEIKKLVLSPKPPKLKSGTKYCKKCSYFEFCWA